MEALIDGIRVPKELLGSLNETDLNNSNDNDLRNNLEKDGYLFLRNVINYKNILKARNDIFKKLNEVNELEDPFVEGIASGKSTRDEMHKDRGLFWESLSNTTSLRQVTNGSNLENVFTKIFGTPSVGFDFIFLRAVASGKFTHMHCDSGFFTRKTFEI